MKAEVLKEYIKKIVQQEVRNVLKNELRGQLAEILTGNKNDSVDKTDTLMEESVENIVNEPHKPKKFVKYTKNEMLNQILNETTGGIPKEGSMVGLTESFAGGQSITLNEVKAPENAPEPVKTVYNAMTRDYSKLLKAIDKKKGIKA